MRIKKTTDVNGLDKMNPYNAMQNNYAWSMVEYGDYIYVGTGRNVAHFAFKAFDLIPPEAYTPENVIMAAEIWRYPKHGCHKEWENVYRAPEEWGLMGVRSMAVYKDDEGEEAIYCGCYAVKDSYMLKSTDGENWVRIPAGIQPGYTTRTTSIHKGKLYTSALRQGAYEQESFLYASENPEKGWTRVNTDVITGEIFNMISFNGNLYLAAMPIGGFSLWRCEDPESGEWKCIVDKGAGDALNETPLALGIFEDSLYIGVGVNLHVYSVDPDNRWVLPKGFDLIKVSKDDKWEVIIGGEPISPTDPQTGVRNKGKYPSGFGNLYNAYCWQLQSFGGKLYLSTFDAAIIYKIYFKDLYHNFSLKKLIKTLEFTSKYIQSVVKGYKEGKYELKRWYKSWAASLSKYPESFGFDLLFSEDGRNFEIVSMDGFGNEENYGLRKLYVSSEDIMYMGTANPSQGCEVWAASEHHC